MSTNYFSPHRLALGAFVFLACAAVTASPTSALKGDTAPAPQVESAPEIEEICINFVCLEGTDRALYLAMQERIDSDLARGGSVEERMATIAELLAAIDDLDELTPVVRDALGHDVLEQANETGVLDPPVVVALLRSGDEDLELFGIDAVWSDDKTAWNDRAVRGELLALLRDPERSEWSRGNVLWLFRYRGPFSEVLDDALAAAGDSGAPILAHLAAKILVDRADSEDREGWIRKAFLSGSPALRREAAWCLMTRGTMEPADALFVPAVRTMADLALDPEAPPEQRGEAIEAIGRDPAAEPNRSILLELLEPQNWFYGATGAHFPIHSLALVVEGLEQVEDPAIRQRLSTLQGELRALPSGQREYVEWVLDNALGNKREIFHAPVDWDLEQR